jgi:hypothetical protein
MSKKKNKKRRNRNSYIPRKRVEVDSPLSLEVMHITEKIQEEEGNLFKLDKEKRAIVETIVDKILLNSELKDLISNYCCINHEIEERKNTQNNRKRDLEYKQSKLTEENKTEVKVITDYMKIGDDERPVGLYNTECKHPVAICKQKEVYLSYTDIKFKGCLKHKDKKPCKHLQWLPTDKYF